MQVLDDTATYDTRNVYIVQLWAWATELRTHGAKLATQAYATVRWWVMDAVLERVCTCHGRGGKTLVLPSQPMMCCKCAKA